MRRHHRGTSVLALVVGAFLTTAVSEVRASGRDARMTPERDVSASSMLAGLPVAFIENQGQWDARARFMARRGGMVAWFEEDALTLQLRKDESEGSVSTAVVRMAFEGASPKTRLEGEGRRPGVFNYYVGNDPAKWHTGVPSYSAVVYRDVYDGVGIRIRDSGRALEYDVLLAPGADLAQVVIRCDGIEALDIDRDGSLLMHTEMGAIRQKPAVAWYELPTGVEKPVACNYRMLDDERYGFDVPEADPRWPLVIDPGLVWSTLIGGSLRDEALDLHVDESGVVTVVGATSSLYFCPNIKAASDAFVLRLDATGSTMTYLHNLRWR